MEPKSELSSAALDWCKEMGIKGKTVEDVLSGADNARFEFKLRQLLVNAVSFVMENIPVPIIR